MKKTQLLALVTVVLSFSLGTAAFALRGSRTDGCAIGAELPGKALPAVANNKLVFVDQSGEIEAAKLGNCARAIVEPTDAILRHVASRRRVGTAYVVDRVGRDEIAFLTRNGAQLLRTAGEAVHPAWSPSGDLIWSEDFHSLKLVSADLSSVRTIDAPNGTLGAFSPVFADEDRVIAIVQEPLRGIPEEDDGLDNLWSYSIAKERWEQLTHFDATADRWSILRSPVIDEDGTLWFVRITGSAFETERPEFSLWKMPLDPDAEGQVLAAGRPAQARTLPPETYLAEAQGSGFTYNVFSEACGDWALVEVRGGKRDQIGCGSVMTDPVGAVDPDLVHEEHDGHEHETIGHDAKPGRLAIVIGDFKSPSAAKAAAAQLAEGARIVGHNDAPMIVRPGAWVVVVPVDSALAEQELTRFRNAHPEFAERSWLTPL